MTLQQLRSNRAMQIPAVVVTVGLMVLFPLVIHWIGGPTAGARWLPMYYAPFVAAVLFNPLVAVVAGLVAPYLNHLLTGAPVLPMVAVLSFELVVFSVFSYLMIRQRPSFWGIAPLAFVVAKAASALMLAVLPLLPAAPWPFFVSSLQNALPGMVVLLLINWLVVKRVPRDGQSRA